MRVNGNEGIKDRWFCSWLSLSSADGKSWIPIAESSPQALSVRTLAATLRIHFRNSFIYLNNGNRSTQFCRLCVPKQIIQESDITARNRYNSLMDSGYQSWVNVIVQFRDRFDENRRNILNVICGEVGEVAAGLDNNMLLLFICCLQ